MTLFCAKMRLQRLQDTRLLVVELLVVALRTNNKQPNNLKLARAVPGLRKAGARESADENRQGVADERAVRGRSNDPLPVAGSALPKGLKSLVIDLGLRAVLRLGWPFRRQTSVRKPVAVRASRSFVRLPHRHLAAPSSPRRSGGPVRPVFPEWPARKSRWEEGSLPTPPLAKRGGVSEGPRSQMDAPEVTLSSLRDKLREFARERDWDQFHTPKNLAMALAVEAAELMEHFQWLGSDESSKLDADARAKVAEEIGDVLIYLVRLADRLGIDPLRAAEEKLEQNRLKYPADVVRGKAKKYTEY